MAARPVSADQPVRSWHLAAPHDTRAQGLVVSGFAALPTGRALFLEFSWESIKANGGGGAWLAALRTIVDVTDADGPEPQAAAMGFTWSGLQKMGLSKNVLASFDRPFREGMFQEDRLRRLGNRRAGQWLDTVIAGGPVWSGNTPLDPAAIDVDVRAFDDTSKSADEQIATPVTVHALLLLYDPDEETAVARCAAVAEALAPHDVQVVRTLPLRLLPDAENIAREHFGFADGISQPIPFAPGVVVAHGADIDQDHWHGVPLGEILIGHKNGHNEVAAGPVVADSTAGQLAKLPAHPQAEGFLDLGIDGSYMVVRELRQNVPAFWRAMETAAGRIHAADPHASDDINARWVAERVVGRDMQGGILRPAGEPTVPLANNEVGFFDSDRYGRGCPLGSHVRRANPRDGLAPNADECQTLLNAANNHRILRRGRKYGKEIVDPTVDDGEDRGLLFVCLNTDITRQFEFVQQTWILNPNFSTLYDETDPLIGPRGTMTLNDTPLRRIIPVETFVQMTGGEYFFLPSMPALDYLSLL